MARFAIANICTAFDEKTIGTKVLPQYKNSFLKLVEEELSKTEDNGSGQYSILLPERALEFVSGGVAMMDEKMIADDFVVRKFRDRWRLFAKRRHAIKPMNVTVIVYDKPAYLKDPDILPDNKDTPEKKAEKESEYGRMMFENPDYVIVAVLASAGPKPAYGATVLVHNIAGGNNLFIPKTKLTEIQRLFNDDYRQFMKSFIVAVAEDIILLHDIIAACKNTEEYENKYIVVAD